ncbi:MAG: DUF3160 domain-containing protein [Sphingobacterium sp.]|nr:DUF3160 domain-containing protein [Sphingobacterium sp.]
MRPGASASWASASSPTRTSSRSSSTVRLPSCSPDPASPSRWRCCPISARPAPFPAAWTSWPCWAPGAPWRSSSRAGDTSYADYPEQFDKLSKLYAATTPDEWRQNLYWRWLHALLPLLRGAAGRRSAAFPGRPGVARQGAADRAGVLDGAPSRHCPLRQAELHGRAQERPSRARCRLRIRRTRASALLPPGGHVPRPEKVPRRPGSRRRGHPQKLEEFEAVLLRLEGISVRELAGEVPGDDDQSFIAPVRRHAGISRPVPAGTHAARELGDRRPHGHRRRRAHRSQHGPGAGGGRRSPGQHLCSGARRPRRPPLPRRRFHLLRIQASLEATGSPTRSGRRWAGTGPVRPGLTGSSAWATGNGRSSRRPVPKRRRRELTTLSPLG